MSASGIWRLLAVVVLVAAFAAAPVRAARFDTNGATFGSGRGVLAFVPVDPAVLRVEGGIPARWGLQLTPAGKATLFFTTHVTPITVLGRTRLVRYELLGAVLDPAGLPAPERDHDTSNFEGSPEDFYLLSLSTSDAGFTDWFRQGTGLGDLVQYVPELASSLGPGPLYHYTFTAPGSSPNQADFTAAITDALFPLTSAHANWWRQTPEGTFKLDDLGNSNSRLGLIQSWQLTTDPRSPLGLMLGGAERSFTCQPDGVAAPLLGVVLHRNDPGCVGVETYNLAEWRKEIVVPR